MSMEKPMWILFEKNRNEFIWCVIVWNLLFKWVSILICFNGWELNSVSIYYFIIYLIEKVEIVLLSQREFEKYNMGMIQANAMA